MNEVQNIFKELKPEYIRTSPKKLWLEDFYEYWETKLNATSKAIHYVRLDEIRGRLQTDHLHKKGPPFIQVIRNKAHQKI
jgi:hypothetical protein